MLEKSLKTPDCIVLHATPDTDGAETCCTTSGSSTVPFPTSELEHSADLPAWLALCPRHNRCRRAPSVMHHILEKKIRNRNMMSPVFEPRFTHMLVHRVTTSEGHLNSWTPQNLHRAPSGYHAALESVHLISTYSINTLVTDTQGQLPIPASDGWGWWSRGRGCWTPIRGLRWDCYQWATSWNICRSVIHHRTSREAVGGSAVPRREVSGSGRTCDNTFWGFHHRFFLSLHDQSDSRTGCCALTRTVFSACNKSMISTDDKRTQWWISVQVPQVHCTTSVISSVRSTEWSWEANVLNKNWNVS